LNILAYFSLILVADFYLFFLIVYYYVSFFFLFAFFCGTLIAEI
jgi:hypothetical protein